MEGIYQSSKTHFRPSCIPLLMRQMGCTRPHQFQQKMLLWSYSRPASLSNISLQYRNSTMVNPESGGLHVGNMTTSGALDPSCSRYLLTGRLDSTLTVHDTHCTDTEDIAGITRTVFPLVGITHSTDNEQIAGVRCVQWYPHDNGMFCSSLYDKIKIWDTESMVQVLNFSFERTVVNHFAMAPVETTVAVASSKGEVHLCDLRSGASSHKLSRRYTDCPKRSANCVTWHPTQTNLLVTGYEDGFVMYWDVRSARKSPVKVVQPAPDEAVHGAAFSSNGRRLVTHTRNTIHSWDPFSDLCSNLFFSSGVTVVPFDPDGSYGPDGHLQSVTLAQDSDLVFACFGPELILHDLARDRPVQQLRGHLNDVNGCILDSVQQRAYTFARDGNLITWQFGEVPPHARIGPVTHSMCRKSNTGEILFELGNSRQFSHYLPFIGYGNFTEVIQKPTRCYSCTLNGDTQPESISIFKRPEDENKSGIIKSCNFERENVNKYKRKLHIMSNDAPSGTDSSEIPSKRMKSSNSSFSSSNISSSSSSHKKTGGTASSSSGTSGNSKSGSSCKSERHGNDDTAGASKNDSGKERTSHSSKEKNQESSSSSATSSSNKNDAKKEGKSSYTGDGEKSSSRYNKDSEKSKSTGSATKDKKKKSESSRSTSSNRVETFEDNIGTSSKNRKSNESSNDIGERNFSDNNHGRSKGGSRSSSDNRLLNDLKDLFVSISSSLQGESSNGGSSTSHIVNTEPVISQSSGNVSGGSDTNINREAGVSTVNDPCSSRGNISSSDEMNGNTASTSGVLKPIYKNNKTRGQSAVTTKNLVEEVLFEIMKLTGSEAGMPDEWSSDDD